MNAAEIRAAIKASAALQELLPDSHAIAAALSAGRVRIVSREVGEGRIADAIGVPAGSVLIRALREMAQAPLPGGATAEQIEQKALIEQAWRLVDKAGLDVGMQSVRASLDALVGVLPMTQADADAIKALAEAPDPVSEFAVRCAIYNDDGSLWSA